VSLPLTSAAASVPAPRAAVSAATTLAGAVDGPAGSPHGPSLKDADFERLREYFYKRTGIQFTPSKRYFVDKRVHQAMAEFGTDDFATYFSALRLGAEQGLLQKLVNHLTVNETYFMREDYQFDALIRSVLPQVMRDRQTLGITNEPVRILSLPSSTGEEPYSIAIRLLEEWPEISRVDVSIAAGDIDTRVLAAARRGEYNSRSVMRVPAPVLKKYFKTLDGSRYQVIDDLRESVEFNIINICDVDSMRPYRKYDVVFCRNLLIYFDEVSCRQAAENIFGALRPGGFCFLGHSESMSRISPIFTPRRMPEGIVYQRPMPGAR
jgi:chemotaxis protein methyltransferase CheR